MPFDPSKQTLDNITQTLINVSGVGSLGTSIPPKLNGEFRVPFAKNLRLGPVTTFLGGTQYTLLWDEPDDISNISHYNIYVVGALANNTSPVFAGSSRVSPGVFRLVTTTASVLTFFIQTQLSNGNCSELSRSPTVTAQSATPTVSASALPTPTTTTLGGVLASVGVANKWVNYIDTLGTPIATQPAFTQISGTLQEAQGGTGETAYTNGQLLIGNTGTGGLDKAQLAAGHNVEVTNGAGSISIASMTAYTAKTANYTAGANDYTIECTSGTFNVTLPTAIGITGKVYHVVNTGVGVITVATTGGQTIMGVATKTLATLTSGSYKSNGANWIFAS